ncbi:uncharacterized protein LY89DRAFT_720883, partial [Mollisia scopiformis]
MSNFIHHVVSSHSGVSTNQSPPVNWAHDDLTSRFNLVIGEVEKIYGDDFPRQRRDDMLFWNVLGAIEIEERKARVDANLRGTASTGIKVESTGIKTEAEEVSTSGPSNTRRVKIDEEERKYQPVSISPPAQNSTRREHASGRGMPAAAHSAGRGRLSQ